MTKLMIWGRQGLKVRSIHKSWTCDYHLVIMSSPVQRNATLVHYLTRRSCWCREPTSDAGHLYRKLAPIPQAMQWIERTLELSANIGKLSINHFTSVSVKDWCMSLHCITVPGPKFTKFRNKFRLARPPTLPNFVALWQIMCQISTVKNFCLEKVDQSSP